MPGFLSLFSAAALLSAAPADVLSGIAPHFEPDMGQTGTGVLFTATSGGTRAYFTASETVIGRVGAKPLRMKLRGGKALEWEPSGKLSGVSNYYLGNDPKKWREGVPHYAQLRTRRVYEGVDVVYHAKGRRLEFDFVVAPHADPSKIELVYEGQESLRLDDNGDLVFATAAGEIRQRKPVIYQDTSGGRVEIAGSYRIREGAVSFALAQYDPSRPLVIDPILEYGTYLGASGKANGVAVDAQGAIYIAGDTQSGNFPIVNAALAGVPGGFVTKIDPSGASLVFSTYFGGSQSSRGSITAIAVDPAAGKAFITGYTNAADFPVRNALIPQAPGGGSDGFVAGFGPAGQLDFSTYLGGGASSEEMYSIAVNGSGLFIGGNTGSPDFPGGSGPGGIVVKLAPGGGSRLFTATLAGANIRGIAVDQAGSAYTTGSVSSSLATTAGAFQMVAGGAGDGFVAKLNSTGSQWSYVTYLGGSGPDRGNGIAVDAAGRAHVAGTTFSSDFPLKNAYDGQSQNASDAFLTVFDASGASLVFSTYLGGVSNEDANAVAVAPNGDIVLAGLTRSYDFPLESSWRWRTGVTGSAFLAKFRADGSLKYSSICTDEANALAVAVTPSGAAVIAGTAGLVGFSTAAASDLATSGAFSTGVGPEFIFASRFIDGPAPVAITISTNTPGQSLTVDGRSLTTPVTVMWQPGTLHHLAADTMLWNNDVYTFVSWSQGGPSRQSITAPAVPRTYHATFSVAPCQYSFSPAVVNVGALGQLVPVTLDTQGNCPGNLAVNDPWLSFRFTDLNFGPKTIEVTAALNPGPPRSGTITAGQAALRVNQAGSLANLPAPTITAPSAGQEIQTRGVQLAWTPVPGAFAYEVRIYSIWSPAVIVYYGRQEASSPTNATIDLPDGAYDVLVRGCTAAGVGDANCGASALLPLTVNLAAPTVAPVIRTPDTGQILRSSTNRISWDAVPGATSYEVTLRNMRTGFLDLHINTADTETVFTMKSSIYRLIVRPCRAKCSDPALSFVDFQVQLPAVPRTAPSGISATITNGNVLNLSWNPEANADLYRVQVVQPNTGPGGGALTVAAKQVSTTSVSLSAPAGPATVVVTACNGDGCGPAGTIPVNLTGPSASVPIVATPIPVVVENGPNVTISWSRIAGDDGSNTEYRLYVGDLSRDGPALDVITKNNFYGAILRAEGRRYDALVFATRNGVTVQGTASGFMVGGNSATAPLVTSPTHGSTFRQGRFRLAWSPIAGAARYQYYVGRAGQSGPVLTGVTPGSYIDTSLAVTASTFYQAIVRACSFANANQCSPDSDAGWGPWSSGVTGTTGFTVVP